MQPPSVKENKDYTAEDVVSMCYYASEDQEYEYMLEGYINWLEKNKWKERIFYGEMWTSESLRHQLRLIKSGNNAKPVLKTRDAPYLQILAVVICCIILYFIDGHINDNIYAALCIILLLYCSKLLSMF